MNRDPAPAANHNDTRFRVGPFTGAALLAWAVAFAIMAIRLLHLRHRGTTFDCFINAGNAWRAGRPVYTDAFGMGFVYSPLIAACFAGFTFIPPAAGKLLWLFTNVAVLVGGTIAVMRAGIFSIATDRARAGVLILLLALSLANLDVAQSNSLLIGLLLLATALAMRGKWTPCAIAVCLAVYLKIYPVAFGLLLCVHAPRKFPIRMAATLVGLGILSLVLQHPQYVITQYHAWLATRGADDRRLNSDSHAPLDLWYLLVRLGHLPISEHAYVAIQVAGGAAIAAYGILGSGLPRERRLAGLFVLCSCWMILLGPATESYTYAILAPALSFGLVTALQRGTPPAARVLAILATLLLAIAQLKNTFFASWHSFAFRGIRPLAAVIFTLFAILWMQTEPMWKPAREPAK